MRETCAKCNRWADSGLRGRRGFLFCTRCIERTQASTARFNEKHGFHFRNEPQDAANFLEVTTLPRERVESGDENVVYDGSELEAAARYPGGGGWVTDFNNARRETPLGSPSEDWQSPCAEEDV